jgi:hypothetical protein
MSPSKPKSTTARPLLSAEEFEASRKRLWDELVMLHDAWDQYETLFGDPQTVRMLNACAGWFFALTQRLLLRETILGISRVTDPAKTGQFENLTLEVLLHDPVLLEHRETEAVLRAAITAAVDAAGPIRTHRHKYIAHLDHQTATGTADVPLPGLPRGSIGTVVKAIEDAYQVHSQQVRDAHTFFDVDAPLDARALVRILEASERWRRYRELNPDVA